MRSKLKALMIAPRYRGYSYWGAVPQAQVYYTINGQPAAPAMTLMMAQKGLAPGAYWYDARTGNWGRMGSVYLMGNNPNGGARREQTNATLPEVFKRIASILHTKTSGRVVHHK
jgi:hypothetical protein